jgi:hypothetical protein
MHGAQKRSLVDWFHQHVIGTGVHSLPDQTLIVLFDQKQNWPFWVNPQRASYKIDDFHSSPVSFTNDGCILNRPDTHQRRERGIYRLYVRGMKTEAQYRSQYAMAIHACEYAAKLCAVRASLRQARLVDI